jgi:hypothetical protein
MLTGGAWRPFRAETRAGDARRIGWKEKGKRREKFGFAALSENAIQSFVGFEFPPKFVRFSVTTILTIWQFDYKSTMSKRLRMFG